MSYYDLLGVKQGATQEQIRSAYRVLVQLFHPDRLQQSKPEVRDFASERLKALNQAYEVLGNPARRSEYDARQQAAQPAPAPARQRPAETERRTPAPEWRPAREHAERMPAWQPADQTPADEAATRRAAAAERNQRKAGLERQIAELDRTLHMLKVERERMHRRLVGDQARLRRHFWVTSLLTGLGSWSVMAAGIVLFSLPVRVSNPAAQLALFLLLAAGYELASAMIIARALGGHLARTSLAPVAWAAGKALLAVGAWGLLGWAGWRVVFGEAASLQSLGALAGMTLGVHLLFCTLSMGGSLRMAVEQRRLYDHNTNLVMQTYRDQLLLARAQRAALDMETT